MTWDVEGFVGSLTGSSPHTRKAYESDLRQFVTWAERGAAATPQAVDHLVLRRYLAYLTTRGMARPTIARKAAALRAFFGWLRKREVIAADPTRNLRTPRGDRRLPKVPKAAEVASLIDDAPLPPDDEDGVAAAVALRDNAVLETLYGAGLRISELCGLGPSDVDLRGGLVTVLGKRSKIRRVPSGRPRSPRSGRISTAAGRFSPAPPAPPTPCS